MLPLLSQQEAKSFDNWLMSPSGGAYNLQQLMELAGLTVALAIFKYYPNKSLVFIATGPGNNGGDGLVAARHLQIFGYSVTVYRPVLLQKPESDFFKSLIIQAEAAGVNVVNLIDHVDLKNYDIIVDALFGFGFKGNLRAPFDNCVNKIIESEIPIVSVDCPNGWTASFSTNLHPDTLISLTAPKECVKHFKGSLHILGGRFIPRNLPKEFEKLIYYRDLYKEFELFIDITKL